MNDYIRTSNGAVVVSNKDSLNSYKKRRIKENKNLDLEKRVSSLENKLDTIIDMLKMNK